MIVFCIGKTAPDGSCSGIKKGPFGALKILKQLIYFSKYSLDNQAGVPYLWSRRSALPLFR